MKKMFVVANWKCNPVSSKEARRLFLAVQLAARRIKKMEVIICPPFVYLLAFRVKRFAFRLGAQDCFWEQKGPYTGEISPLMLRRIGCTYVIVGHSERRRYFGETNAVVNKKLRAALQSGLKAILCIGETGKERKDHKTESVLRRQLQEGLSNISVSDAKNIIVAYEPVWAIGSGNPCSPKDALKTALVIKDILASFLGERSALAIPILYGGSVNARNATDYREKAGMQGLLIGGSSLRVKEFVKILDKMESSLTLKAK
jgi:triosephosphate isomerase